MHLKLIKKSIILIESNKYIESIDNNKTRRMLSAMENMSNRSTELFSIEFTSVCAQQEHFTSNVELRINFSIQNINNIYLSYRPFGCETEAQQINYGINIPNIYLQCFIEFVLTVHPKKNQKRVNIPKPVIENWLNIRFLYIWMLYRKSWWQRQIQLIHMRSTIDIGWC